MIRTPASPIGPLSQDPDAALVSQAQAGSREAFTLLMQKLQTRTFRFILRFAHEVPDAEDLTQETFLEAYRNLHAFQGHSRFSSWVMGIALNLARNKWNRRPDQGQTQVEQELLEEIPDPREGPHERARANAAMKALGEAMDRLPKDLREALTLVSLEGMSYEDAAELATIPIGTMKTRVFRARKALREDLERSKKLDMLDGE